MVKAEKEEQVNQWTRQIIASLDQHQVKQLHFRTLPDYKKKSVCRQLAALECRLFVLISHKRNMQNYTNINAAKAGVNKTAWFYAWCSKLLLESMTDFCRHHAKENYGHPRTLRCEFSATGGVKLQDIRAYYKYIKDQALMGLSFKNDFPLAWDAVDHTEMHIYPNETRYGLQLADVVASAFYSGLEKYQATASLTSEFAELLLPRICQDTRRKRFMYGVKVLPRSISQRLEPDQRKIFDFYQYK